MEDIAGRAERVIGSLRRNKWGVIELTTGQIRKFLTAVNSLTNKITVYQVRNGQTKVMSDELAEEVSYLQVKIAYQVGRNGGPNGTVGDFEKNAELIREIQAIGNSIPKYMKFARFMEALVAYHKYSGGKD